MCMHLLKLPLYLIALPFYILSAIGRGGLCAVSGGGRLWRHGGHHVRRRHASPGHRQRAEPVRVPVAHATTPAVPPSPSRSWFVPGMVVGAIGCVMLLAASMVGFVRPEVVPGVDTLATTEFEVEQLIDQVIGFKRPQIPVAFAAPSETGDDLPPAENALEASVEETEDSTSVVVFRATEPKGQDVEELPAWAVDPELTTFPELSGVIQTGPHATVEEAEREALLMLRLAVAKVFERSQPSAASWLPPEDLVLDAGVVQRRAIESSKVNAGEFNPEVFTAYWDVSQPDDLESRLFAAWRPEALKSRLWLLGGGIGLLTFLFGSLAGYFRFDDATQGKYRNKLRVGTGALWVAVAAGSALLLVA